MLTTYYVKRARVFKCERFGLQHGVVMTDLLRVTCGRVGLPVHWEWVCTGERVEADELDRLMRDYPLCEFQDENDLLRRINRAKAAA